MSVTYTKRHRPRADTVRSRCPNKQVNSFSFVEERIGAVEAVVYGETTETRCGPTELHLPRRIKKGSVPLMDESVGGYDGGHEIFR